MHNVKVFDRKNPDRQLGTLHIDMNWHRMCDSFSVAVLESIQTAYYRTLPGEPIRPSNMDTAVFTKKWVTTEDNNTLVSRTLKQELVLLTDASLDLLTSMDSFTILGRDNIRRREARSYY